MARTTTYLGAFGYNESPEDLGEPHGFWRFEDYEALELAYETSTGLNDVFREMGAPTYSKILWAIDPQAYTVFHVLILSTQGDLYGRQFELLDTAVAWLKTQGHPDLDASQMGIAGTSRVIHARHTQEIEAFSRGLTTHRTYVYEQLDRENAEKDTIRAHNEALWAQIVREGDERDAQMPVLKRQAIEHLCQLAGLEHPQWLDLNDPQAHSMDWDIFIQVSDQVHARFGLTQDLMFEPHDLRALDDLIETITELLDKKIKRQSSRRATVLNHWTVWCG